MTAQMAGFKDKLYWREVSGMSQYHCFKRDKDAGTYESLCGNIARTYSGGQSCNRPIAALRCAQCDIAEMKRRGWEESGPASS